ncbi:hypothetical protein [Aeromonas sobria]|uniref:hypothetical protein n=1 Tax=Aeromonas sobria TaxID=646 RepID=UPI00111637BC|nr:hypothetical protein [Aeromonas sobria]TNH83439.1 hypothetical protein CF140_10120 [Aeromonas sobria]
MNKFNVTKVVFGMLGAGLLAASFSSQAALIETKTVPAEFTVSGARSLAVTWTGETNLIAAQTYQDSTKLGVLNVKVTGAGDELILKSQHRNVQGSVTWPAFMGPDGSTRPVKYATGSLLPTIGEYAVSLADAGGSFNDVNLEVQTVGTQTFHTGQYTTDITVVLNTK